MQKGLLAAAGLGSIVIALSGCGIIGGSSANQAKAGSAYGGNGATSAPATTAAPMQPGTVLKIGKTSLGDVLTTSRGLTIYWLSKDVRGMKSVCTGSCITAWPAVTGKPAAASGIKLNGVLGSITRPDGTVQATYNGYPLYTYAADTAPGQVSGNGEGNVWHVITGKVLTSMTTSGTSGSSRSGSTGSGSGSGSGSGGGGGYGSGTPTPGPVTGTHW